MSASMNYDQVRVFAQLLREFTGRDVKHSQILRQIASAKHAAYDALMHRLKSRESERLELTEAELQSIATLLSAVSKRTIEPVQIANAATLSVGNAPAKSDIYTTWATFKGNAQGRVSLFLFTPDKQASLPDEDFGFEDVNLVDASLLAPTITNFRGGVSQESDIRMSHPFTLKLLVVPEKDNRFKNSGFQAVNDILHALTAVFAPEGTRYMVDGCVFRPSAFKRVPAMTAQLTHALERLRPLFKDSTFNITSGYRKSSPQQRAIHSRHNHSSPFNLLRHTLNRMVSLQSIPPHEWRKEINSIEVAAHNLTFQGHSGPLSDYKRLIQSLFSALKTIIEIHELASVTFESGRWKDAEGLMTLIENIILKDKQRERVGNAALQKQLAKDVNASIGQLQTMGRVLNGEGNDQTNNRTNAWVSAVWELMRNPLWTMMDDIGVHVGKNPMTAYNGYRLSAWTPD